mmetsp:Transcript_31553/g.51442  ORF Transcript_31553/g.51442 Transcript_31553/m.51442 type:complete len:111 (+) Transcript_31553:48-380(+)
MHDNSRVCTLSTDDKSQHIHPEISGSAVGQLLSKFVLGFFFIDIIIAMKSCFLVVSRSGDFHFGVMLDGFCFHFPCPCSIYYLNRRQVHLDLEINFTHGYLHGRCNPAAA